MNFLQIGTLITIREISRNILEIPAGIFADSIGRKKTMIGAFLFYLSSFLLFYLFSGYSVFILAMLLYSFGDAFRTGTHKAMILITLRSRAGRIRKSITTDIHDLPPSLDQQFLHFLRGA